MSGPLRPCYRAAYLQYCTVIWGTRAEVMIMGSVKHIRILNQAAQPFQDLLIVEDVDGC